MSGASSLAAAVIPSRSPVVSSFPISGPPSSPSFLATLRSFLSHLSISAVKLQQFIRHLLSSSPTVRWGLLLLSILGPAFILLRRIHRRYLCKYPSSLTPTLLPTYDYIIVGAGSAGCVLANRLSANPAHTVLLLEAGGSDDLLDVAIPAAAIRLQLTDNDWQYQTTPQPHANLGMTGHRCRWPRGRMLGGSSSMNYMLWVRGEPEDYDAWEALGLQGWGWRDCLPFFQRVEAAPPELRGDAAAGRGTDGPMSVELLRDVNPNTRAFIQGCQQLGIPLVTDYNGPSPAGVSLAQYNTKNGRRHNAASGYLVPALQRPNLHVLTHAQASRILFTRDGTADRLVFRRGQTAAELRAGKDVSVGVGREVVLAAGAINSPHLLMLSGVGDREHLSQHNLPCVSHLPGVGHNLQDHVCVGLNYATKVATLSVQDENAAALAQLYLQGRGPLASSMAEAFAFLHSSDLYDGSQPGEPLKKLSDIQLHFTQGTATMDHMRAFNFSEAAAARYMELAKGHWTQTIVTTLVKPRSSGFVQLANSDPFAAPIIDPQYLSHPADITALVASCRLADRIIHTPAMQVNHLVLHPEYELLSSAMAPNNPYKREAGGEEEDRWWKFYVQHLTNTLYHPVGTCKMGRDDDAMAVCDSQCRVRGVKGVRVVDASVMPKIATGNTQWPTMMIAERGAAFILADHEAQPTETRMKGAGAEKEEVAAKPVRAKL